jgi:hypothetical protein
MGSLSLLLDLEQYKCLEISQKELSGEEAA